MIFIFVDFATGEFESRLNYLFEVQFTNVFGVNVGLWSLKLRSSIEIHFYLRNKYCARNFINESYHIFVICCSVFILNDILSYWRLIWNICREKLNYQRSYLSPWLQGRESTFTFRHILPLWTFK